METKNETWFPTNDGDVIEYLQTNQALLKTILSKLETKTIGQELTFDDYLKEIKSDWEDKKRRT